MDIFSRLSEELQVGLTIVAVILGAFILTHVLRWIINKRLTSSSKNQEFDPTHFKFLKNTVSFFVWTLAIILIIYNIPQLKTVAVGIFAGVSVIAIIVGFAGQHAFSNIISGVFIIFFKPYRVGDLIRIGEKYTGIVDDITLRHTIIVNFENKKIIIPNSVISNETIINDSLGISKICRWVDIGISYDSDMDRAIEIIQEEAIKHPNCIDNRTEDEKNSGIPQVIVRLISFGDFSINLRAYVWTHSTPDGFILHTDINKSIKKRFDKEGIEIPFPYRTIVYKKDIDENSQAKG
jgi:small-conductance mechanosensitive channel